LYAVRYSAFVGEDFDVSEVVELGRRISLSRLSVSLWVKGLCFGALLKIRIRAASMMSTADRERLEDEMLGGIFEKTLGPPSMSQRELLPVQTQSYQLPARATSTSNRL
jgi:hypothetical protein